MGKILAIVREMHNATVTDVGYWVRFFTITGVHLHRRNQ